jgi:hypothetical protein
MGAEWRRHKGWRTANSERRRQRWGKREEAWRPEIVNGESGEPEQTDRLLVSALRFWEVERDLIEERLAARGR